MWVFQGFRSCWFHTILVFVLSSGCTSPPKIDYAANTLAEHVVIVSIDGGRTDVLLRAHTPALNRFLEEGAYTLWAETGDSTRTLSSHISMLTGTFQAVHGIDWNTYKPDEELSVETIFDIAKAAGKRTAVICSKIKLKHLDKPGSLDIFMTVGGANEVASAALELFSEKGFPHLTFIHFSDVDVAGHQTDWGSSTQIAASEAVDYALGQILDLAAGAPDRTRTVVILTADHGGHLRDHGSEACVDRVIPWLAWGDGVKQGYEIRRRVKTYDTAATALWLLGIPSPYGWQGQPIKEIMTDSQPYP